MQHSRDFEAGVKAGAVVPIMPTGTEVFRWLFSSPLLSAVTRIACVGVRFTS
jgi:hypothetical protein